MFSKKILTTAFLYIFFVFYFSLFFFRQMNLPLSDLGRHIQNGNVILQTQSVFNTNLYSFTYPNFTVLNHHWLFGVIAYTIFQKTSFEGLVISSIIVHSIAISILLWHTKRLTSVSACLLAAIITLPLIAYRTEFRPEVFSYLFIIIFYIAISQYVRKNMSLWKILCLLIPIQIIWVNIHIFFIMSLVIVGVFGIQMIIQKNVSKIKMLTFLGICLTLASLCNPFPIAGLMEPLQIFREYGYQVAENQSVWFLSVRLYEVMYSYIYIMAIILCFCLFICVKKWSVYANYLPEILLAIIFMVSGLKLVRLLSFAGIFLLPFIAIILHTNKHTLTLWYKKATQKPTTLLISTSVTIAVLVIVLGSRLFIPHKFFGLGLLPNNNNSGEFFKANNLTGPIFNNYDIGGYLIFHLYPQEKVFVDNRPEAYPSEFFQDVYIPMQQSEEKWQEQLEKYKFNTIFFYRHDLTEWAQQFLINRVNDDAWVPIFVDEYSIIFIKNTEENQAIIEKFRLPKDIFSVTNK